MPKYLRLVRLGRSRRHRAMTRLAGRALRDERGGEVLEYAMILGLVVVGVVATVQCVGAKVLAKWNSADSAI